MLDIHQGQSKESAAKTASRLRFDESAHVTIFAVQGFNEAKFVKLSKMKDYYADAAFINEELPELIKEIDETIKRFPSDTAVTRVLRTFRSICEAAINAGEAVFCFAD